MLAVPLYFGGGFGVLSAIRFLWVATSGCRLRPWRSEYLKWRIETYSGIQAESVTPVEMLRFLWRERWNLVSFLRWAGKLEKQAARVRPDGRSG